MHAISHNRIRSQNYVQILHSSYIGSAVENIVKSLTTIFWLKSLEKSFVLCLREFSCSLVKTLQVLLREKET